MSSTHSTKPRGRLADDPIAKRKWPLPFFRRQKTVMTGGATVDDTSSETKGAPPRWSMGVLNDAHTIEVPGSVLLLTGDRNEPLGLRNIPARTSTSSIVPSERSRSASRGRRPSMHLKKTADGAMILDPQPDDSRNDPLNWPAWRRDSSLFSLGFYCMVGGGMTPVLAAGFTNVAADFDVSVSQVALTTGLYMMGLGVGGVLASPTAILFGKRPVYLFGCVLFIGCSVWCAASPNYNSLVAARVLQGVAVSPIECSPSATIAEIFFLHERAYRIGIYTLLLLGGKNLIPLVSAAIIQSFGWRWVFWIVAMIGGLCLVLLFLFVPETFWDRSPKPKSAKGVSNKSSIFDKSNRSMREVSEHHGQGDVPDEKAASENPTFTNTKDHPTTIPRSRSNLQARFVNASDEVDEKDDALTSHPITSLSLFERRQKKGGLASQNQQVTSPMITSAPFSAPAHHDLEGEIQPRTLGPLTPALHNYNSPFYTGIEESNSDFLSRGRSPPPSNSGQHDKIKSSSDDSTENVVSPPADIPRASSVTGIAERPAGPQRYTTFLKEQPPQTFVQQLRPFNGRLHNDNWFRVAFRPFVLFLYPAVLWSAVVYACSVGWLIVLSESVAEIYRSADTYNFSALSTGLIYLSPFIGGVLGTAVAGKVSDIIVKWMSRRNGGLYEPEFRLVMAVPIAITTVIGLMGFGWSAQERDAWIVPTIFFGLISFGCSLGSTTAITFVVDSYRQYAGEALVTLNFSKNILHGLVFSLFFNKWLAADGSRDVFLALGGIQLGFLLFTIPMFIFGKRLRMWTVRKNFMERF